MCVRITGRVESGTAVGIYVKSKRFGLIELFTLQNRLMHFLCEYVAKPIGISSHVFHLSSVCWVKMEYQKSLQERKASGVKCVAACGLKWSPPTIKVHIDLQLGVHSTPSTPGSQPRKHRTLNYLYLLFHNFSRPYPFLV